jgi:predicted DNA-binding transcriptional regulator YafY
MNEINCLNRLHRICRLINQGQTGKAEVIAQKLEISKRTFFRDLSLLKDFDAKIEFSKTENSYYFEEKFEFVKIISRLL